MGIKDIKKFAKDKSPRAFFDLDIQMLRGHKIAIDANNWMFTNYAIARKKVLEKTNILISDPDEEEIYKVWLTMALEFILKLFTYDITPVFTFDGVHPPEKDETKRLRREERQKIADAITEDRRKIAAMDPIERSTFDTKNLLKNLSNYTNISSEGFDKFRNFLDQLAVPVNNAKGDGEQLCCSLCWEGKVSAVFSADTDCLVYGCPLLITGFSKARTEKRPMFSCIRLDYILEDLAIDYYQFVDLCIMCGTDFNTKIRGYAAIKSSQLLAKHRSIDLLPAGFDVTPLKHHRCRELFSYKPSEQSVVGNLEIDINIDRINDCGYAIAPLRNERYNPGSYIAAARSVRLATPDDSNPLQLTYVEPFIVGKKSLVWYL